MKDYEIYKEGDIVSIKKNPMYHNRWIIIQCLIGGYEVQNEIYTSIKERPLWEDCELIKPGSNTKIMPKNCPDCKTAWNITKSPVLDEEWKDCPKCNKTAEIILGWN